MKIQYSQSYYEDTGKNTILDAIAKTRFALENAYDNATDPDLIDCYIYEVNSLLKRYRFLYHQAQELGLFPAGESIPMPNSVSVPMIPVMQDGLFT